MSHAQRASPTLRPLVSLALALLCALALAACGEMRRIEREQDAAAVALGNPELRHPIGFTPKSEALEVEVPAGAEGLSPNQQVDVTRFLRRFRREAAGRLVLSVPTGVRDRAALAQSLQEIQRRYLGNPDFSNLPCDDWSRDVGRNEERIPYPNWGCATQRNLALTADNARDLGQPQPEDPRSGERRSATWSAYVASPTEK